jgi:hypothetical protein
LVRQLMQTMCAQLPARAAGAPAKRTPAEALRYAQQLYRQAVQKNSAAFNRLLAASDKAGVNHGAAEKRVAQEVQASLWRHCPVSGVLFSQLAQTQQLKQVLAARLLTMGAAEKLVLQPVAGQVCKQLAAADKQLPIGQRTLAEQDVLVEGNIRRTLAAHRPQLETFYSKAQLANQDYIREILVKVMLLVLGEDGCGQYIVTPAADE